jgi:hypothetical protein
MLIQMLSPQSFYGQALFHTEEITPYGKRVIEKLHNPEPTRNKLFKMEFAKLSYSGTLNDENE